MIWFNKISIFRHFGFILGCIIDFVLSYIAIILILLLFIAAELIKKPRKIYKQLKFKIREKRRMKLNQLSHEVTIKKTN